MSNSAVPVPRRLSWLVVLLGLVALAILIGLGTWQVQRLHWKEELLATIEARTQAAPLPLAEVEALYSTSGNVDYIPVVLTGAFHHDGERHLLATWQGQSGFFVYTPLELADDRFVLVNRGFVPYDKKAASSRPQGQVAGEVTVKGLARDPLAGKPSWIVPNNDPDKNVFYWKDRDGMARSAGLRTAASILPFFVDVDATPNPGGLPIGGVTLIDLPNNHLQYAVTWYGLAVALLGVLAVALWRRRGG